METLWEPCSAYFTIRYRCIGVKYIQSIINEIIWVEGNLQSGVEDILNEIFGFLSIIIQIIFILSIPFVLFIKPAYQRMVLRKEWWQILGHAKSDQDETEWTVPFRQFSSSFDIPAAAEIFTKIAIGTIFSHLPLLISN